MRFACSYLCKDKLYFVILILWYGGGDGWEEPWLIEKQPNFLILHFLYEMKPKHVIMGIVYKDLWETTKYFLVLFIVANAQHIQKLSGTNIINHPWSLSGHKMST